VNLKNDDLKGEYCAAQHGTARQKPNFASGICFAWSDRYGGTSDGPLYLFFDNLHINIGWKPLCHVDHHPGT
ncbi:Hypothetical predicted protein, partial [Pelobates cultripes]